jgi:hypothetical protein
VLPPQSEKLRLGYALIKLREPVDLVMLAQSLDSLMLLLSDLDNFCHRFSIPPDERMMIRELVQLVDFYHGSFNFHPSTLEPYMWLKTY